MKYKTGKEKAREQAKEWQLNFENNNYSYYDLTIWQNYFEKLAKRYGLKKEFKENGII